MKTPRHVDIQVGGGFTPGGWVEVAPGLSFGVRAMPSRWARFWMAVLLDWKFHARRPV